MFRKAFCFALVAITSLLSWEAPAWAAGGDPKKIGSNLFDIVSPNVKSFWKLGVVAAVLVILISRPKGSFIAATLGAILLSGVIIWNPDGLAHMVNAVGRTVF